jgi:CRISPR-associated endonuclease/helicase Cas3
MHSLQRSVKQQRLDFDEFFFDVHGVDPFPWQTRLATQLIDSHRWPDLIDLPTSSGKTACIDIALFHLAWCAERGERWRAARRIVFVVDRRIIVDDAADRAALLLEALEESSKPSVRRVAAALQTLGGSDVLMCQKLRGGMPRERGFAVNPAQPMVITSTVDQFGSRLLFRGYGVSSYSWPIHAGLLAYDTLLLVDEAHLSEPFTSTVAAIAREQATATDSLTAVQPLRVVTMSATAKTTGTSFRLDAKDLAHPLIARRRTAPKPARLVTAPSNSAARIAILVEETLATYKSSAARAPRVAVIVNRVKTARTLYDLLEKRATDFDVELLIGRSRPLDRDVVAERISQRAKSNRDDANDLRGLIVVATQTIEVGADLDFHGMVTECAALGPLRQRFGRLDRLGGFRKARAVIVGDDDAVDDPIYGKALQLTWRWLASIARDEHGERYVDFSIKSMERQLRDIDLDSLSGPSPDKLQLTRTHVDLLCQTSPSPMYGPDIGALLHGLNTSPPDLQIVWRSDLPVLGGGVALDPDESEAGRRLLDLNPPTSLESLALSLSATRAWLEGHSDSDALSDMEGEIARESEWEKQSRRLRCQVWRRGAGRWEMVSARDLRPGDTIVVPCTYAGCDKFGFAPDSDEAVIDLSSLAREKLEKSPLVVITKRSLAAGNDGEAATTTWQRCVDAWRSSAPIELLHSVLDALGPDFVCDRPWLSRAPVIEVLRSGHDSIHAIVVMDAKARRADISDENISASQTVPVLLRKHNAGVGRKARDTASELRLSAALVSDLELAGSLHDIGKGDPRFQRLLRGEDETSFPRELLAKGRRSAQRIPDEPGERHEAYSVAMLHAHPDLLGRAHDRELVEYLVGSHHGRGRPLMPDRDDDGAQFNVDIDDRARWFDGTPRLGRLGSEWPSLFWRLNRRYGAWGLAYLEAVLRLADWMRSVDELEKGADT